MPRPYRWRNRYIWYRTASLSVSEHSLICDLLSASKGFALSLVVLFGIGVYASWGYVSGWWLGLFIVAFIVEASLKVTLSERFRRLTIEKQKRPIWRFLYDVGAAYSSVIYGLAGLAMFVPMPDENRVLLIGVYCTIVCAVATSTAFFQPIARWIIPALVAPTIVALMFSGKPEFWLLTLVIAIGVVGAVYLSSLSQMRYSHVSELNEQNKVLVTKLSAQQQVADEQRCLAEKAVIDKSRFIAAASHDLRQPLHAMTLFHHALRHKSENESNRPLFDSIDNSTFALNAMFDSLLDVSKLDANVVEPEYEPVSIQAVFSLLSQEFQPIAKRKALFLNTSDMDVSLYTDQTLFTRILRNLISNALKFTQRGGVEVDAKLTDEHLLVTVSDTGVGIPDGEHARVFTEFYQLGAEQRHGEAGVGLGLSMVNRLSILLGMQVKLDAMPTGGTRASLIIACSELVDEPGEPEKLDSSYMATEPNALTGLNIIFIDDNDAIRLGMYTLLSQWRCCAVCVADEKEALSRLAELQMTPDLIIGDYQLAGTLTGIDAIVTLRSRFSNDLPGMLISGATSPDDLLDIKSSGLPYLTKPVSPEALHQVLSDLVSFRAMVSG